MCFMDQCQLQVLVRQSVQEKEKYREYKYPEVSKTYEMLEALKQQIVQEQNSYRWWLTISMKQLHLDVMLQAQQNLISQPCVLLSSQSEVLQLNKLAYDSGIRTGMNRSQLNQINDKVNILKIQNYQNIQEVFNLISRYLQQIDKEVEIDQNQYQTIFQLDITNYMSEKGYEKSFDVATSVIQHIHKEFKVEAFAGIGTNSLLSFLASEISKNTFVEKLNRGMIVEINDFKSHQHLDIKILKNLSESLIQSLNSIGIDKIADINNQLTKIYETFPYHITASLAKIYFGVGRCYHNINNEIDTLKVSRVLKLGEYSIRQLQSQIDQIIQQLIMDMKHYKKIAKIVKLQLTKIDHNTLTQKREFQRIESDYFELFKVECQQMLKSLQIQNLLLQKVTIQVFEMKPLESIEIVDTTFAQRFYKALLQQQQQNKEIKRQSTNNRESSPNVLTISKIIQQNNPKISQNQSKLQQNNQLQETSPVEQYKIINNQQQIQQKQNYPQDNTVNNQQLQTIQQQIQLLNMIEQQSNSSNQTSQNSFSNTHNSVNSNQINIISNNQQSNHLNDNQNINQFHLIKENNLKQFKNNSSNPQNEVQSFIQTSNKASINQKTSSKWFTNRMTPVSEGIESEKQSNISDYSSKLKYQGSMPSNITKNEKTDNRNSFITMAQQQIQNKTRTSLNDIKLNLNNVYANLENQDSIGKLLLEDNISEEGYTSDDSISNLIEENKRKSRTLVPDSIIEDEESNFTFQGALFKDISLEKQNSSSNIFSDRQFSNFNNSFKQSSVSFSSNNLLQHQNQQNSKSNLSSEKKVVTKQGSNLSESKEDSLNEENSQNSYSSRQDSNQNLLASKKQYLNEKFTCPLCGNQIDCKGNYSYINNHVDKCLEKQNKQQENEERGLQQTIPNNFAQNNTTVITEIQSKRRPVVISEQQNQSLSKQSKRGRPLGSKNSSSQQQKPITQSNSLFAFGFKK